MSSEQAFKPRHDGRTAVVTGGGRGIGRAIALNLAEQGARVIVVGRDESRLAETCRISGNRVRSIACDIRDEKAVEALATVAPEVDILIHNAAAFAPFGLLEDLAWADLPPVWETITSAPMRLTQFALPSMKSRRFGRILFMGSAAAALGGSGQVAYSSAKAALGGLARSVACEAGKFGVTANVIELGLIETERVIEAISEERRRQILRRIPACRMGKPEEIAEIVSFLASDSASYINGATIPVNGGLGLGLLPFSKEGIDARG